MCFPLLTHVLTGLKPCDILFIDEIHALPRSVEEILYPAMEDGRVPVMRDRGDFNSLMKSLGMGGTQSTTAMADLTPFTLIGASTLSGLVSAPLRSRFVQTLTLEPYSDTELQRIVLNAAGSCPWPPGAWSGRRRSRWSGR